MSSTLRAESADLPSLRRQIAAASRKDKEGEDESNSAYAGVGAAEAHGNNPSRGARIDAEVRFPLSSSPSRCTSRFPY